MSKYKINNLLLCLFCLLLQKNVYSDNFISQHKDKLLIGTAIIGYSFIKGFTKKFLPESYNYSINKLISNRGYPCHSPFGVFSIPTVIGTPVITILGKNILDKMEYKLVIIQSDERQLREKKKRDTEKEQKKLKEEQNKEKEKKLKVDLYASEVLNKFATGIIATSKANKKIRSTRIIEKYLKGIAEKNDQDNYLIGEYLDKIEENKEIIEQKIIQLQKDTAKDKFIISEEKEKIDKTHIFQKILPEVFIESLKPAEINEENSHTLERMVALFENVQKDKFDESNLELLKEYKKSFGLNFPFHNFLMYEAVRIENNFSTLQQNYNFNSKLLLFINAHYTGADTSTFPILKLNNKETDLISELNDTEALERLIPFLKQADRLMREKRNTKKLSNTNISDLFSSENINLIKYNFLDRFYYYNNSNKTTNLLNILFSRCEILLSLLQNTTHKSSNIAEALIRKLSGNFLKLVTVIDKLIQENECYDLNTLPKESIESIKKIISPLQIDKYKKIFNDLKGKIPVPDQECITQKKESLENKLYTIQQIYHTNFMKKINNDNFDWIGAINFYDEFKPRNDIGVKIRLFEYKEKAIKKAIVFYAQFQEQACNDTEIKKDHIIENITTIKMKLDSLRKKRIIFLKTVCQNFRKDSTVINKLKEIQIKHLESELYVDEEDKKQKIYQEIIAISQEIINLLQKDNNIDFQAAFNIKELVDSIEFLSAEITDINYLKNIIPDLEKLKILLLDQLNKEKFKNYVTFFYAALLLNLQNILSIKSKCDLPIRTEISEYKEYVYKYKEERENFRRKNPFYREEIIIKKLHFDTSEKDIIFRNRYLISENNLDQIENLLKIK